MSIYTGQIGTDTSQDKIRDYERIDREIRAGKTDNYISGIPINKIEKDVVRLKNGGKMTIYPSRIAKEVKDLLNVMRDDPNFSFLSPYINKPIIWTYEAKTAFTDGIRIYMSPLFATKLMGRGAGFTEAEAWWGTLNGEQQMDQDYIDEYFKRKMKYVMFVIVHECYHIFYNHIRRASLKYGGHPTAQEKDVGNISMDLEINRDIESTFEFLRGSTEFINGIWYKNPNYYKSNGTVFSKDIWEDVWDDFIKSKKSFKRSNPTNSSGVNPKQKSTVQQSPYADGWRKAVDSIKRGLLNPNTFNI